MSFPGLGRARRTDGLRAEGAGERTEPLGSHRAPARHRTRARGALPSTAQALRGVDCHRLRKGRTSPRCLSTAMQVMVSTSVTTAADCTKGTILQTKAPARGDRRVTHRGAGAPPPLRAVAVGTRASAWEFYVYGDAADAEQSRKEARAVSLSGICPRGQNKDGARALHGARASPGRKAHSLTPLVPCQIATKK